MTSEGKALHILVIPLPAQGHLIPMLDLAHHLSLLLPSLSLTVLSTPTNLPLLHPFLSSTPSASPLLLPLSLPPAFHHVRTLPSPSDVATLIHAYSLLSPDILLWCRSNAPAAILADFFFPWTHHLAADLSVPRLVFYGVGPLLVSIFHRLWLDLPRPADPAALISFPSIPGSPSFSFSHLPSLYRRYVAGSGSPEWDFLRDEMVAGESAWAAVFNTFDALDGVYLCHLKGEMKFNRVFAVGPIHNALDRGGGTDVVAEELAVWLDGSPAKSVVYVCFGSQFTHGMAQGRALGEALEGSGARFVWCVGSDRVTGSDGKLVPEGFEERVKGRGMVVRGWAPQLEILRHRAVASFLTHCGWNSVLEGIVAGVMLLAWPMEADQFLNARVLVEEAGAAVLACAGGREIVPDPEELGKLLAESVNANAFVETRARSVEMGRKAKEAVLEGGSSFRDMEALVAELSELGLHNA
ncbi:hypothetical protein J5N97_005169 [Dioscorea zingiberensis]|uniref:Uncharacterized protein n=1 Tax=Dioscorea zingiberensis TaxID=325984 RepID=A0A9D5D9Q3_9LILI|nr:hypothetical protein J5N97_005169 [Dioscorea zingiberensis]